jgi:hypothetical protein
MDRLFLALLASGLLLLVTAVLLVTSDPNWAFCTPRHTAEPPE